MEEHNPRPAVPPNLVPAKNGVTATVLEEKVTELFYHDCTDDDVAFAKQHLCPQPLGLLNTPRNYILCTEDRALCLEFQNEMIEAVPGTKTFRLNSGHSPFFSMPDRLVETLIKIDSGDQGEE